MAVAGSFHNLNTLLLDGAPITGCTGMSWTQVGTQAVSLIAGDGVAVHYSVKPDAVAGSFTFHSIIEAEKMASQTAASKNATFKVKTEADADLTVTVVNIKTSAALGGQHSLPGAGPWAVQFVADSVSNPV